MICACTSKCQTKDPCKRACPLLEAELRKIEAPQRDIIMPIGAITELLNIQGDPWEVPLPLRNAMISEVYQRLPERPRECLRLHFGHRLSVTEIARNLAISRATVRIHMRRGLEAIFKSLEENMPPELDRCFPSEVKPARGYILEGRTQKFRSNKHQADHTSDVQVPVTKGKLYGNEKIKQCA